MARASLNFWNSQSEESRLVWIVRFLFLAIIVWSLAVNAHATTPCNQFFTAKQYAYVAPVYAAPVVQYYAGQDIQAEALAEKVARLVDKKLELRLSQRQQQVKQQQTGPANGSSVIAVKCSRCHANANPKGGVTLDGQTPLLDEQFRRVVEMVGAGKNVPPEMKRVIDSLTPAEKGSILDEMIALEPVRQQQPLPPPAPAPANGDDLK